MLLRIKIAWSVLLGVGMAIGIVITGTLVHPALAQVSGQVKDNTPLGRESVAIVDHQYPASYFPNTETLGPDEMRITALGTGMPNQTRAAVSISFLPAA